jgi:hypothetical protein
MYGNHVLNFPPFGFKFTSILEHLPNTVLYPYADNHLSTTGPKLHDPD